MVNRFSQFSEALKIYRFKLPFLAPVGFYLTNKIPHSFNFGYERKIRYKLAELFGEQNADVFFRVHSAQRVSLTVFSLFFFGLIYIMGNADHSFIIFGLIVSALLYYWTDRELDKKIKERKRDILIDLPEFLNTLALLIGAGLPFNRAVHKVVSDKDVSRPLYKELKFMLAEIDAGKPTVKAYEDFARRCRVPEITRLVSVILQNINRGNGDQVRVLRTLAAEAWEGRKDIARKKGEEAASKLVFPMVMVFIAVSIIVLAPAVMTMTR